MQIAVGSTCGDVSLWEIATGQKQRELKGAPAYIEPDDPALRTMIPPPPTTQMGFSPDGQFIFALSPVNVIVIWKLSTGAMFRKLKVPSDEWLTLEFSSDSKSVYSFPKCEQIQKWSIAFGALQSQSSTFFRRMAPLTPTESHWIVEEKSSSSFPIRLALYDLETDQTVRQLDMRWEWTSLQTSPDGRLLLGGAQRDRLDLWDLAENVIHQSLLGYKDRVGAVDFSSDGRMLASVSGGDNTIRVWAQE